MSYLSRRSVHLLARLVPAVGKPALREAAVSRAFTAVGSHTPTTSNFFVYGRGVQTSVRIFSSAEGPSVAEQARAARAEHRFEALKELDASELHTKLTTQFDTSGPPGVKELCLFLDKCHTSEDAELAVNLIKRFRTARVYNLLLQPFSDEVSTKLVQACVRGGCVNQVLEMLVRANEQGLVLSEDMVEQLAADTRNLEESQVDSIVDTYNQMQVTRHVASVDSTSAVLMTLLKGGEIERSLQFSESVAEAGQKPLRGVWELVAAAAKEAGLDKQATTVQRKMDSL